MLSVAYLTRMITDWAGQERLRALDVRFTGITAVHDAPSCTGRVTERFEADGETRLRVEVQVANGKGDVKIAGEAVVAVVTAKPGATLTAEQVQEHVAAHLASYKVPSRVLIREQRLPRNPAGKVLKNELRALCAA